MIKWLKNLFKRPHRHDYEMVFLDPEHPFKYTLRCECGDVAKDMVDALRKMGCGI